MHSNGIPILETFIKPSLLKGPTENEANTNNLESIESDSTTYLSKNSIPTDKSQLRTFLAGIHPDDYHNFQVTPERYELCMNQGRYIPPVKQLLPVLEKYNFPDLDLTKLRMKLKRMVKLERPLKRAKPSVHSHVP